MFGGVAAALIGSVLASGDILIEDEYPRRMRDPETGLNVLTPHDIEAIERAKAKRERKRQQRVKA